MITRNEIMYLLDIETNEYLEKYTNIEDILFDPQKIKTKFLNGEYPDLKIDIEILLFNFRVAFHKFNEMHSKAKHITNNKKFHYISLINSESKLIISDKDKFIFDKLLIDTHRDYKYINLSKSQIIDFSNLLIEEYSTEIFANVAELKYREDNMSLSKIEYHLGILDSLCKYLNSISYNL